MIDYYATFGPAVPEDLDRLAAVLATVLFGGRRPRIYSDVDRLVRVGDGHEYSLDGGSFDGLRAALAGTATWDGLELHFDVGPHRWAVLLWRDRPGMVTVTLCEPGAAFREQVHDEGARRRLARWLVQLMDGLGAGFCILEAESTFRTRTAHDIGRWLRREPGCEPLEGWPLVICDEDLVPAARMRTAIRETAQFSSGTKTSKRPAHWVLSQMGAVDGVFPWGA